MLYSAITEIPGVGKVRAEQLLRLGIESVYDMLYHFPRRFEDRSKIKKIFETFDGESVCVCAVPKGEMSVLRMRKNLTVYRQCFVDDSGIIDGVWYNNPYIKNTIKKEKSYMLYGKISSKYKKKEIIAPVLELEDVSKHTGRIVPIYNTTANLTQKGIMRLMEKCLELSVGQIPETIPDSVRKKYNLAAIDFSMQNIHFPKDFESYSIAMRRFVFEEFFELQTGLRLLRGSRITESTGPIKNSCPKNFVRHLSFELTGAQRRVIDEIYADIKKDVPMNRLVQGDVGCGKTAVAAYALYSAVQSGFQGVLMAPTEILATQHFESFSELFEGVSIVLLSGKLSRTAASQAAEKIENGQAQIIIGTHALIEEKVKFHRLGLIVTDEQHRFGVRQRTALYKKGLCPHTLVMSATPIPRTLSLMLYGDLDISVIDELPPGRQRVDTFAVGEDKRDRAYEFVRKEIAKGRQAYVVCPMVEESETLDLQNVMDLCRVVSGKYFKGYSVSYIHGKMRPSEKDEIMARFRRGEIKVLVSTTVIEVGVNVRNATIMVIENAERFGLSQLHQLRGRVGRGSDKAYCIMFSNGDSPLVRQRLETMTKTGDGFKIAQKDLELRGPGDFFGTRQHGLPELKIANIFSDMEILKAAGQASEEILQIDRNLSAEEHIHLKRRIRHLFKTKVSGGAMN